MTYMRRTFFTCLRRYGGLAAVLAACLLPASRGIAESAQEARAPAAKAFAQLPQIRSPELSPEGGYLALLRPVDGRYLPVVLRLEEGQPARRIRLDPGESIADVVGLDWSGERYLLISVLATRPLQSRPDGRVFVYDTQSHDLSALLPEPRPGGHSLRARRESQSRTASVRLVDPLRFVPGEALVVVNKPRESGSEVRRVNLSSGSHDRVLRDGESPLSMRADASGRLRLIYRAPGGQPEILYRAAGGGDWQSLTPPLTLDEGHRVAGLAGSGDGIWVLRPSDGRGRTLHRFDPERMRFSEPIFGPTEQDVDRIITELRPEGRRLLGYRVAGDFRRDIYLREDWRARQARIDAKLTESVNAIVSSNAAADIHVVRARSAERPDNYYLFDAEADRLTHLANTYPDLAERALPGKRPVAYPARDGTSIPAYLTLPATGAPPFPTILLVHGGPTSRVHQNFFYWTQFLASRGYAVLEPNFRGSEGYGQAWEDSGRLEWGGLMQRDIADGARWLLETRIADPERLCIMGGSFGGYAALMGVAKSLERYACAIAVNAVSDLERMVRDDRRRYPGAPWTRFIGLGSAGEMRLEEASPVTYAERVEAPVLLFHSRDDLRVPVRHSIVMADELESAGKPVNLVTAKRGGHPLTNAATREKLLTAVEEFLARHLRSRERAAAADAS